MKQDLAKQRVQLAYEGTILIGLDAVQHGLLTLLTSPLSRFVLREVSRNACMVLRW